MRAGDQVASVVAQRQMCARWFVFGAQTGLMVMMDCFLALFAMNGMMLAFGPRLRMVIAIIAILLHIGFAISAAILIEEAIERRRRVAIS